MTDWIEVEQARGLPGLRLVLTAGVPGPWGEAAKGLFFAKRLAYTRVRQNLGAPNSELLAWTGHDNAPQAVVEGEPARTTSSELIFLAERLAPEPALIPSDAVDRAQMFGLIFELAGENGFGWSRRLMLLDRMLSQPMYMLPANHPVRTQVSTLGRKYGYSAAAAAAAPARVAEILRLFSRQLAEQQRLGRRHLVGPAFSALDIYWAAFAAMVAAARGAVPDARGPPQRLRDRGPRAAQRLLAHRDFVYREHLELPVRL